MSELDIVMPVYNEGNNIIDVLDKLESCVKTPFRLLVCYDDDKDITIPVVREYRNASFQILLVKNRGVGVHAAVVSGLKASAADAVVVFPADDTYNAGIIDCLVEQFREGCDIVCASRFMEGGRMEGCRWLKSVLVRSAAFTLYHVARVPTRDASNGFRLFSRRLLDSVAIESRVGFTYSIELLVKCQRLGWKVAEVPALWFERKKGVSRFRILKWLPAYLRWYFYAYGTTYLNKGPESVRVSE